MTTTALERPTGTPGTAATVRPRSGAGSTGVLAIVLAGYFMVILDNSIVITGLPHIAAELDLSGGSLGWVQNAYLLTFGGLLLLGARAGDILGRRQLFVAGLALFTLASVAVGLAPTGTTLIAARGVQGIGAAILASSTLALLTASFREGPERTRATAAYGAVAGIGASVGLVAGGLLADLLSWRVGFLMNLPIGVAMLVAGRRVLPETPRTRRPFDLPGALLATLGPAALVYGFARAGEDGWSSPVTLGSMAAGALLLVTLVLVERTAREPVLVLRLFTDQERVGAYLGRALFLGAMMGFFLFTSQHLQDARGWSPLAAGLGFLPMTIVNVAVATTVPRLRRGPSSAVLMVGGLALSTLGMAALGLVGDHTTYALGIGLPMALIGAGQGLALGPLTGSGIARVDPAHAGAASGVVNSVNQLGGALGTSLTLAVSATYPGAMRAGAVMLALALLAAAVLVVPAARSAQRAG